MRPPTLPHGFAGVATSLRTPELVEVDQDMPVGVMSLGMVLNPGTSSVCSNQVVKDDKAGLVYLDTVMTFMERMVIGSTDSSKRPNYRGHDGLVVRTLRNLPSGGQSLPHCNPELDTCHWVDIHRYEHSQ